MLVQRGPLARRVEAMVAGQVIVIRASRVEEVDVVEAVEVGERERDATEAQDQPDDPEAWQPAF